jgi:hypothetical protein
MCLSDESVDRRLRRREYKVDDIGSDRRLPVVVVVVVVVVEVTRREAICIKRTCKVDIPLRENMRRI